MAELDEANLLPPDRAKRYRVLAEDARREAARAPARAREAYLRIAEQWDPLAAEIESKIRPG